MKAKGVKELNRYQMGDKLTNRQAIIAKCADCMCLYVDGKEDCQMPDCPLYPVSPYGNHPVFKSRASHKVSEKTLKALASGRDRRKHKIPVAP